MKKRYNILDLLQNILGAKLAHLIEPSKGYWSYTGTFSVTNVSRWLLDKSKRSLERFYAHPHDWRENVGFLLSSFFEGSVGKFLNTNWLLTVDETVDKKSGKRTHGVGYHYSSKAEKVLSSIAILNVSLTHTSSKLSLPILQEQLLFPTEKTEQQLKKKAAKKKAKSAIKKTVVEAPKARIMGRPLGSTNKSKATEFTENEEIAYTFQVLGRLLGRFVEFLAPLLKTFVCIKYVVGDGGFGNNTVARIVRNQGFDLISKLQYNAALYLPFEGQQNGTGRHKMYGDKVQYDNAEVQLKDFFVEKKQESDGSFVRIYHLKKVLHKSFGLPLNVVIVLKFDKNGQLRSHKSRAILFSTDLEATHKTIIDSYQVRFQIEFNFRDARQFFGLSNFKNVKKQQVQNVIGYAFFMVALSNILIFEIKQTEPNCPVSTQDLKAFFRAEKYVKELLNRPDFKLSILLNRKNMQEIPLIGAIHAQLMADIMPVCRHFFVIFFEKNRAS